MASLGDNEVNYVYLRYDNNFKINLDLHLTVISLHIQMFTSLGLY